MDRPPTMLTSGHQLAQHRNGQPPLVKDLGCVEAENDVARGQGHQVSTSVPSPAVLSVMLAAVTFDHQAIADQEIDAADAGDLHLRPHTDADIDGADSKGRLQSGFGARIEERYERTASACVRQELDDTFRRDQALVES